MEEVLGSFFCMAQSSLPCGGHGGAPTHCSAPGWGGTTGWLMGRRRREGLKMMRRSHSLCGPLLHSARTHGEGEGEWRGANTSRRCSQSPRTWSARPSWAAAARGAASAPEPPRWTRRQSCWRRWRPGWSGRTAASPSWPAARSSPCSAPRNTSSRRHVSAQCIHTTRQLIIITQVYILYTRVESHFKDKIYSDVTRSMEALASTLKCAGYIINVNRKYFIYFLINSFLLNTSSYSFSKC